MPTCFSSTSSSARVRSAHATTIQRCLITAIVVLLRSIALTSSGLSLQFYVEGKQFSITSDFQTQYFTWPCFRNPATEGGGDSDLPSIDFQNQIARFETCFGGGSVAVDCAQSAAVALIGDSCAEVRLGQKRLPRLPLHHLIPTRIKIGNRHMEILCERSTDGTVDANDPSMHIKQR